jgi:DeoR family fructose operon transcriptional repressor
LILLSTTPLFAEERRYEITKLLSENTKLLISSLCEQFDVSPATIRSDLRVLERKGALKRTHGGAISVNKTGFELATRSKEVEFINEKRRMAAYAETLIDDGDTVLLDTGTTTMELAKLLTSKRNLTIVTNDIRISLFMEENTDASIFLLGGMLRRNFHYTIGMSTVQQVSGLNVDKAFIATNGICAEKGFTTPALDLADIKKAMIAAATMVVFMADSRKLGRVTFAQFAELGDADRLITDNGADGDYINRLKEVNRHMDIAVV